MKQYILINKNLWIFWAKTSFSFLNTDLFVLLRTRLQNVRRAPRSDVSDSEVKTDKYEYILLFHFYQPVPLRSTCMEEGGELEPLKDSPVLHTCLQKRRSKTALWYFSEIPPDTERVTLCYSVRWINKPHCFCLSVCLSVCLGDNNSQRFAFKNDNGFVLISCSRDWPRTLSQRQEACLLSALLCWISGRSNLPASRLHLNDTSAGPTATSHDACFYASVVWFRHYFTFRRCYDDIKRVMDRLTHVHFFCQNTLQFQKQHCHL